MGGLQITNVVDGWWTWYYGDGLRVTARWSMAYRPFCKPGFISETTRSSRVAVRLAFSRSMSASKLQ
jgi:hypothetical protein